MNYLSLFSGIGGIDLGLDRAGMTCIGQVEIDEYCQRILAKHWPDVPRHDDVRTSVEWWQSQPRPTVDLIVGGFPCQDVSYAGPRVGIDGARSGLWHHMVSVIRRLRPRYVLVENTPGLLARGMGRVLADLATLGVDAEWSCVSACSMGAPHMRDRVFIMAHPTSQRPGQLWRCWSPRKSEGYWGLRRQATEPPVTRVATRVSHRVDRLRSLGNAVVPQVAEHVGRLIIEHDQQQVSA